MVGAVVKLLYEALSCVLQDRREGEGGQNSQKNSTWTGLRVEQTRGFPKLQKRPLSGLPIKFIYCRGRREGGEGQG